MPSRKKLTVIINSPNNQTRRKPLTVPPKSNQPKVPNETCVLKEKIGKGAQAELYPTRNSICVQKKYMRKDLKEREEKIMKYINRIEGKSPYVIRSLSSRECCKNGKEKPYIPPRRGDYIFLEHIEGMNLRRYFHYIFLDFPEIDLDQIKIIFANILDGIEWLHNHGIAHGDIQETNIMWGHRHGDRKNKAIIVDFGAGLLGSDKRDSNSPKSSIRGSLLYGYNGTRDIEVMKIQDYKAVAVMFFRFVNRFMWNLNKTKTLAVCYPFKGYLADEDELLFSSYNCNESIKSRGSNGSRSQSCKCNYLNSIDTLLKRDLKKKKYKFY